MSNHAKKAPGSAAQAGARRKSSGVRRHGLLAEGRGFFVAAINDKQKLFQEWRAPTWELAIQLAKRARREFPGWLILFSDGDCVWRLEEIE